MKKVSTGIMLLASLVLLAGIPAEAGRHRYRSRTVRTVQYAPCLPCIPSQGTTSIGSPTPAPVAEPSQAKQGLQPFVAVPCVCADDYLFTDDDNGDIYYSAIRYYPSGFNCTNCMSDATYLIGNYPNYPYPCGDDQCEPDISTFRTNTGEKEKTRPIYRGTKKIDWNFDPTTDYPAHITAKILHKEIRSFLDVNRTQRLIQVYYLATYNQRTHKSATLTVGYELLPGGLSAEQLKTVRGAEEGESIVPIDQYGRKISEHTYVYLNDAGKADDDVLYFLRNDLGQAP